MPCVSEKISLQTTRIRIILSAGSVEWFGLGRSASTIKINEKTWINKGLKQPSIKDMLGCVAGNLAALCDITTNNYSAIYVTDNRGLCDL